MIAKGVYVGECVFNRLVSRLRKRWIDSPRLFDVYVDGVAKEMMKELWENVI